MARTRSRRSRPRATAASPPSDPTLDADLRDRPLCRPLRGPEARLGGLGQRPDSEVLAAPDLLAVVVLVITAAFERQPERVDVQLAGGGRVERDHGHAREELDLHATSSFALCWKRRIYAGRPLRTISRHGSSVFPLCGSFGRPLIIASNGIAVTSGRRGVSFLVRSKRCAKFAFIGPHSVATGDPSSARLLPSRALMPPYSVAL